jgi:uncharacterized membrane protein YeaQ/YmgE (transglycosylase-associated protein family)
VGLVVYLIVLFFVGLVVGALARLLLPGPDPMGIGMTALVGCCGTFSAGLFSWYVLVTHPSAQPEITSGSARTVPTIAGPVVAPRGVLTQPPKAVGELSPSQA